MPSHRPHRPPGDVPAAGHHPEEAVESKPESAVPANPAALTSPELRGWVDFALLSGIWGSSYLFIKIALNDGLSPISLVVFRLGIAAAFLALLARVWGGRLPRDRDAIVSFAILGAVNAAIPWLLISWGAQWIPSALASILAALTPLFTIVLAALVLHDEPITVNRAAGLLLGFCGAVVLASPNLGAGGGSSDATLVLLGELAVVAATVCYASGLVFARHRVTGRPLIRAPDGARRPPDPLEISYAQVVAAFVIVVPLMLGAELASPAGQPPLMPQGLDAWISVAWLGILGAGVAFVLSFRVIARWGATRMSLVTYVIPVVAITLGVLVLDEEMHPAEIIGTLMILSGIVLASSGRGKRRLFGRSPA